MCEFCSWIEVGDRKRKYYFLTDSLVDKALERGIDMVDISGHEAIRRVFGLEKGVDRECIDFSSPDNFPVSIVKAIKAGKMGKVGIAEGLLTKVALAEYERAEQVAWAEYERAEQVALAEYERVRQVALAEYERAEQVALAEYQRVRQVAWAEYQRVPRPAFWDLFSTVENRAEAWR